ISATLRPSCAATAVTDRPAAPAPITARSNSGIAPRRTATRGGPIRSTVALGPTPLDTATLEGVPDRRQQRERGEAEQRQQHARRKHDREIRSPALGEHAGDALADRGEH